MVSGVDESSLRLSLLLLLLSLFELQSTNCDILTGLRFFVCLGRSLFATTAVLATHLATRYEMQLHERSVHVSSDAGPTFANFYYGHNSKTNTSCKYIYVVIHNRYKIENICV